MRQRIRALGAVPFTLGVGVGLVGVPIGILINAVMVMLGGGSWLSPANAVELTYTLILVAPVVGALAGRSLWLWNEERLGVSAARPVLSGVGEAREWQANTARREQQELDALRDDLRILAATKPRQLKLQSAFMALAGYGYVLAVIVSAIAGIVWLVNVDGPMARLAFHGAWILGFFTLTLLLSLWVRVEEPMGVRVTRAGSPMLFSALDDIQRKLDVPAPDHVLLTMELNAAVMELPRYGIFGLSKRYLIIGLPLLESHSLAQVRAILAHELAHLSRRHARGMLWVSRVSATWATLMGVLQGGRHWARWMMLPFFRWYAPRLELHARAVSQMDEFEADALAASSTDSRTAASALLRLHLAQRHLGEVTLPGIYRESVDRREPPHDFAERIAAAMHAAPAGEQLEEWARQTLADETLGRDTHPSIYRRIERLTGLSSRDAMVTLALDDVSTGVSDRASEQLLGKARLPRIRASLSERWQLDMVAAWRGWHAAAQLWRAPDATGDAVALDIAWARTSWAAACESPEIAIPALQEYLRRDPSRSEAELSLGRLLIERTDSLRQAEGVRVLERAHLRDTEFALEACTLLEAHYSRVGSDVDRQRVQARARQVERELLSSLAERLSLSPDDSVTAHPLPPTTLALVRGVCESVDRVRRALVVRKHVRHLSEQECLFLVVEPEVEWYKPAMDGALTELRETVHERLLRANVTDLSVVAVEPRGGLLNKLRMLPGAEIFKRSGVDA